MFAARLRAAGATRQIQRSVRTYASQSSQPRNESFGTGSLLTVAAFFGGVLLYQFVPADGEDSVLSKTIAKYQSRGEDWAEQSTTRTRALQQAGYDRNLFENASDKHRFVDVAYPEAFTSHAPRNIQAGQLRHLDDVVEHYRVKQIQDDERKMKKLAEQEA